MDSSHGGKVINSVKSLEACVGKTPGPRDLKVIDFLDDHALRWISVSSCMVVSAASKANGKVQAIIAGGQPGFVQAMAKQIVVPRNAMDSSEQTKVGDGWGTLFLIPTYKETMRVNGKVSAISDSSITMDVTECYLHCAKAFMRSKLWEEFQSPGEVKTEEEFCTHTRFLLVATCDTHLRADLSPKGDPAGKLLKISDGFAYYPDRPGNRRVDGFRNNLTQPQIETLALIAGSSQVLRITGTVTLFSEHPAQEHFRVNDKLPLLTVQIKPEKVSLETNAALERAALWPPVRPNKEFKASKIWQDHMKLSKIKGLDATIAKTAISVPGVIQGALDWDYKNNLY